MKKIIILMILINFSITWAQEAGPKRQKSENGNYISADPNTSFKDLILQGKTQLVADRLKHDPNLINFKDEELGSTPLMLSIQSNSLPTFMEIVNKPQDFNALDKNGANALFYLFTINMHNRILFAKILLQKGVSLEIVTTTNRNTPLIWAAKNKDLDLTKLYLNQPFYNNLNIDSNINAKNSKGVSAFEFIINLPHSSEKLEVSKIMIEKRADINTIDNHGNTPLIVAISKGDIDLVKFLLDNGANLNLTTIIKNERFSPLTYIINLINFSNKEKKENLLKIMELLIDRGASLLNIKNSQNEYEVTLSPLFYAAYVGNYDVVRFLVSKGAKENEPDLSASNVASNYFNRSFYKLSKAKKEEYLRVIRFLRNKFEYVENAGNAAQTKNVLSEHSLPKELSNLIGEYITGSFDGDNNFIDTIKKTIHLNRTDKLQLLRSDPISLLTRNSLNETPLLAAIKEENTYAITIILNILKDLPSYEMQKLNAQEKAIIDQTNGVANKEQTEKLKNIEQEKKNFTNNFHQQLQEAYKLAEHIANPEIIGLLEQYKIAFQVNEPMEIG